MTKTVYDSDKDGVVDLLPRAAFNSTLNAPEGTSFTLSTEITAPAPGILLMSGGIDAQNVGADDLYSCLLKIDGSNVAGTFMNTSLDGSGTPSNIQEDCTTTGAEVVAAGTYPPVMCRLGC